MVQLESAMEVPKDKGEEEEEEGATPDARGDSAEGDELHHSHPLRSKFAAVHSKLDSLRSLSPKKKPSWMEHVLFWRWSSALFWSAETPSWMVPGVGITSNDFE